MDRELIIRLAREAGFADGVVEIVGLEGFSRFAALVVANNPPQSWMSYQEGYEAGQQAGRLAEREACAKIVDDWYNSLASEPEMAYIAAEIRSRT